MRLQQEALHLEPMQWSSHQWPSMRSLVEQLLITHWCRLMTQCDITLNMLQ